MKNILTVILSILVLINLAGCVQNEKPERTIKDDDFNISSPSSTVQSLSNIDKGKIENIAKALSGALMLGESWTDISGEGYKYNLSLTTFYCIMNQGYPNEIPASDYEAFAQKYFAVTVDALRAMDDYDKKKNAYIVSQDISIDRSITQSADVFVMDGVEIQDDGIVKLSYRLLWGGMAASGDGTDTVLAGNILYEKKDNNYRVKAVEVTEDNSDKYSG